MTVLSVAGSTALVFAGFALLDVANAMGAQGGSYAELMDSIALIAFVVVVFALLLCVFVVYNLTNLNVGERKKELATLGVLGYHAEEMMGYIYREIFIMAFAGAIVGLGMGMALIWTALEYLEFVPVFPATANPSMRACLPVPLFCVPSTSPRPPMAVMPRLSGRRFPKDNTESLLPDLFLCATCSRTARPANCAWTLVPMTFFVPAPV